MISAGEFLMSSCIFCFVSNAICIKFKDFEKVLWSNCVFLCFVVKSAVNYAVP